MNKVLLTGHSGFLGNYIKKSLIDNDFALTTLGRDKTSDIVCDLSKRKFDKIKVNYIVHVAGKAHLIPKNNNEAKQFYQVNVNGTKNLLASIDTDNIKNIIFISSVAVYGREEGSLINEKHTLKGSSPYAKSKIEAEKLIKDFGIKWNCKTVILRIPLITGKPPVGNLKAMIKAIENGYYFRIGDGKAKRSLIAANDIANAIPEIFNIEGVFNFTDNYHPKISEIDTVLGNALNKRIKIMPYNLIKILARIGDKLKFLPFNTYKFDKLTKSLTFSNEKIKNVLVYKPENGLKELI